MRLCVKMLNGKVFHAKTRRRQDAQSQTRTLRGRQVSLTLRFAVPIVLNFAFAAIRNRWSQELTESFECLTINQQKSGCGKASAAALSIVRVALSCAPRSKTCAAR